MNHTYGHLTSSEFTASHERFIRICRFWFGTSDSRAQASGGSYNLTKMLGGADGVSDRTYGEVPATPVSDEFVRIADLRSTSSFV